MSVNASKSGIRRNVEKKYSAVVACKLEYNLESKAKQFRRGTGFDALGADCQLRGLGTTDRVQLPTVQSWKPIPCFPDGLEIVDGMRSVSGLNHHMGRCRRMF